jgi:hypothetical protein
MAIPQSEFRKFVPFAKVDAARREVWGAVTAEVQDKDGETCHYESSKEEYKSWSTEFTKATDGKSCGNLREMHQLKAVGKGVAIDFRDSQQEIFMGFKVVDEDAWQKVDEGVYTGFSHGGKYKKRWSENGQRYYTALPTEVSLVDNPALGVCHFAYIKADGSVEMRKTRSAEPSTWVHPEETGLSREDVQEIVRTALDEFGKAAEKKTKRVDGVDLPSSAFAYVGDPDDTGTWKLPIKFPDEEQSKSHIRNALARFSQTQGIPAGEKSKVLGRIKAAAKKYGIGGDDADKALLDELDKAEASPSPTLRDTHLVQYVPSKEAPTPENPTPVGSFQCSCGWTCPADPNAVTAITKHQKENVDEPSVRALLVQQKAAEASALLSQANERVAKGLYDVSQFAQLLEQLSWLQWMAAAEAAREADDSPVPAALLDQIRTLCQTFLQMAEEETGELLTRENPEQHGMPMRLATHAQLKKASALLTRAAQISKSQAGQPAQGANTMSDLTKKAGLIEHLQKAKADAQDHHEKMQAQLDKCVGCVGGEDDQDAQGGGMGDKKKAATSEKTAASKGTTEEAVAKTAAPAKTAESEDFLKTVETRVNETLAGFKSQFEELLGKLNEQLEPPKAKQTGRVVTKTQDSKVPAESEEQEEEAEPVFKAAGAPALAVSDEYRTAMKRIKGVPLQQ